MGDILAVRDEYQQIQWAAAIQECKVSELTNKEYCIRHELSEKSFCYWQKKLRTQIVASAPKLVSLEVTSPVEEEQDYSEQQIQAVGMVIEHLQRKKVDTTIHTLLKMSRLPLKDPKTFENFDFSVMKGRDANRLRTLPSLSAIYAHRNLAFIGPAGTGKTHQDV